MKLGLFGVNMGALAHDPDRAVEVARAAEAAGWESAVAENLVSPLLIIGRMPTFGPKWGTKTPLCR